MNQEEYIFEKTEDHLISIKKEISDCSLFVDKMEETEVEKNLLREKVKKISDRIIVTFVLYNSNILVLPQEKKFLSERPIKLDSEKLKDLNALLYIRHARSMKTVYEADAYLEEKLRKIDEYIDRLYTINTICSTYIKLRESFADEILEFEEIDFHKTDPYYKIKSFPRMININISKYKEEKKLLTDYLQLNGNKSNVKTLELDKQENRKTTEPVMDKLQEWKDKYWLIFDDVFHEFDMTKIDQKGVWRPSPAAYMIGGLSVIIIRWMIYNFQITFTYKEFEDRYHIPNGKLGNAAFKTRLTGKRPNKKKQVNRHFIKRHIHFIRNSIDQLNK